MYAFNPGIMECLGMVTGVTQSRERGRMVELAIPSIRIRPGGCSMVFLLNCTSSVQAEPFLAY